MVKNCTIAEAAVKVAEKYFEPLGVDRDKWFIAYGDLHQIHEIAKMAGMKESHPLNIHQRVFAALERSPLWVKKYYRAHRGLARVFYLNVSALSA